MDVVQPGDRVLAVNGTSVETNREVLVAVNALGAAALWWLELRKRKISPPNSHHART